MLYRPSPQRRRGPWTAEEQAAIERAIAEGRPERVANGAWRESLPTARRALLEAIFGSRSEPRR